MSGVIYYPDGDVSNNGYKLGTITDIHQDDTVQVVLLPKFGGYLEAHVGAKSNVSFVDDQVDPETLRNLGSWDWPENHQMRVDEVLRLKRLARQKRDEAERKRLEEKTQAEEARALTFQIQELHRVGTEVRAICQSLGVKNEVVAAAIAELQVETVMV